MATWSVLLLSLLGWSLQPVGAAWSDGWPTGLTCLGGAEAKQCKADGEGCNLVDCARDAKCYEVQCGEGACTPQCIKDPGSNTSLCPDGQPLAMCLVDPCISTTCPEGTKCVANYCDRNGAACTATCEGTPSGGSGCPDGQPPAMCLVNPCDPAVKTCPEGTKCVANYCDRNGAACTATCEGTPSGGNGCPPGKGIVNCLLDPCDPRIAPKCKPGETCNSNYCGGCNAECKKTYTKPPLNQLCPGGRAPHKTCPRKSAARRGCKCNKRGYACAPSNPCNCNKPSKCVKMCPGGQPPAPCLVNPCDPRINPCGADETCTPDYCSSSDVCKANCTQKVPPSPCPNGEPLAQCKMSPCNPAINPCAKDETCTPNYCGGCHAICSKSCPPGVPLVQCFVNPCSVTLCPKPTTCQANYCGGCNALCIRADVCPVGAPEVTCVANPCNPALKPCKDGEICSVNRCGQCSAVCSSTDSGGSSPLAPVDFTRCHGGGDPVKCLANPCDVGVVGFASKCPADLQCVPEYCGGCNYDCLSKARCANGFPRRACTGTANGCMLARCGFGATCVPNQCGNCVATCVGPCKKGYYINAASIYGPRCEPCLPGYMCPGAAANQPTPDPVPCNGGLYNDEPGQTECKRCTAGTTTPAKPADKGYTSCA